MGKKESDRTEDRTTILLYLDITRTTHGICLRYDCRLLVSNMSELVLIMIT